MTPGSVVSTSHDALLRHLLHLPRRLRRPGRLTWDFSQFGASLRNTMDLRGRPGFSPGHLQQRSRRSECFFDAACGDGVTPAR